MNIKSLCCTLVKAFHQSAMILRYFSSEITDKPVVTGCGTTGMRFCVAHSLNPL